MRELGLILGAASLCAAASGQATLPVIATKAIAEVETKVSENGRDILRLLPADRVVPGDEVVYTIEVQNTGTLPAVAPAVSWPVPEHMAYIADSATGPGAEITYSVDGGLTFERPDALETVGPDGRRHPAKAEDYTHIRWKLKITLQSKSVAYARFRAVVK